MSKCLDDSTMHTRAGTQGARAAIQMMPFAKFISHPAR